MTVRNPVPKSGIENAKRNLAAQGTKVELYSKNILLRTFYVGGTTPDSKGTYMIMQDAEIPFVTHILGWEGYLTSRFDPSSESEWRDLGIFRTNNPTQIIEKITLQSLLPSPKTLEINRTADNQFQAIVNDKLTNTPTETIEKYLQNYTFLNVETYQKPTAQTDSIAKTKPEYLLNIQTTDKKKLSIVFFNKIKVGYNDNAAAGSMPDPDRYYYYMPATNEFGMAQIHNYEKIFAPLNAFH
jgi:hypothetical protein